MNKIALSLLALAAISTASFAAGNDNRTTDLRDSPTYMGKFADVATAASTTDAIAVVGSNSAPSLSEIIARNMEKNLLNSH